MSRYSLPPPGVGAPSGIRYNATGITRETFNIPSGGSFNDTFVNNFRLIARANGPSLHVHQTLHVTFNANARGGNHTVQSA